MSLRTRRIVAGLSAAAIAIALAVSVLPGVATAQPIEPPAVAHQHHDRGVSAPGDFPTPEPTAEPEGSDDPGGPAASALPVPTTAPNPEPSADPNANSLVYTADTPSETNPYCDPDEPDCQPAANCDPDEPDCQPAANCDPDEPDCQPTNACDPDEPDCAPGEPKPEGENERDEIGARLNWFLDQRAYPNLTVPDGALSRAQRQAATVPVARSHAVTPNSLIGTNASGHWTSIGPRPIQISSFVNNIYNGKPPVIGRVTAIATHPTNANIVYIGTAFGGVWKTTNGGTTWTAIFDAAGGGAVKGSLSIGAIAIAKTNPNIIYVGTGEANSALDVYFGNGVYKSTNGGTSWSKVGGTRFDGCGISRIVIDAGNANIVMVATRVEAAQLQVTAPCVQNNVNPGVHRTVNGGGAWTASLANVTASDLVAGTTAAGAAIVYAAFDGGYLYKSTNHGATWNQVTTGPPAGNTIGRMALATSANGKTLYEAQATYPGGDLYGHFFGKSTDGGATHGPLDHAEFDGGLLQPAGRWQRPVLVRPDTDGQPQQRQSAVCRWHVPEPVRQHVVRQDRQWPDQHPRRLSRACL